jgi:cytochrome c biogenesis protein CcmG/thiol:disulfide interchange protein DsbE
VVATLVLLQLRATLESADGTEVPAIARGAAVPDITCTTLDGASFSLTSLRGQPVIINFWGPSCIPCREEFPLFKTLLAAHEAEGLAIVGVLMDDPAAPARDFISQYDATWPTIEDPRSEIRNAYRVAARPQSYFVDRDGILRSIQVGELTQAEFDRQYAAISGRAPATTPGSSAAEEPGSSAFGSPGPVPAPSTAP